VNNANPFEQKISAPSHLTYIWGAIAKPYIAPEPPKRIAKPNYLCSCVLFLQAKYPADSRIRGYGQARKIPTSPTPTDHGFAVTYESSSGHLIEYEMINGQIRVIDEANFINCKQSSGRIIPPGIIKGYLPL